MLLYLDGCFTVHLVPLLPKASTYSKMSLLCFLQASFDDQ